MKINSKKIPGDYQFYALTRGHPIQRQWHRNRHNLIRYLNFFQKNDHVLDAGCGSGNVIFEFSNDVKGIVGLDNNKDCIIFINKKIKEMRIKNVDVKEVDLLNFKLKNRKFDKIIMTEIIEHFSKKDVERLLQEIKKVLSPKGEILITTPNYHSPWILLERTIDLFNLFPKLWGEQHLLKFTSGNLSNILKDLGFKIKKTGTLNLLSPFIAPFSQNLADKISFFEFRYINFGNLLYVVAELKR